MLILSIIFAGFCLAALHPHLHKVTPSWSAAVMSLYPTAVFVAGLVVLPQIGENPLFVSYPWLAALGLNLSFRLDGFSLLFVLLISGIGTLVLLYAGAYFGGSQAGGRTVTILLVFMSSMLGLVCSENLLLMFVFWELTSVCSYLLIGYKHESLKARKAALQALLVTGAGGLSLLAGVLLLGQMVDTYELSALIASRDTIVSHANYSLALALILIGAFTKSAQVPFHFWLPGAMEAPTPVSSYLHSATMVKAGIFLLARLAPVLGGTALWSDSLMIVGATTMILGAFLGLVFSDLKHILAYSTVSALGTLVMLIGIGSPLALKAALAFTVVHALYKAALFMIAGTIDTATGTREISKLHGLAKQFPMLAAAAALAGLSMAGVPPFFGFVGKELIYKAFTSEGTFMPLFVAAFVANAMTIAIVGIAVVLPFFRKLQAESPVIVKKPALPMVAAPLVLAFIGLGAGIWASLVGQTLIEPAVAAITLGKSHTEIKLWYGFNLVLLLSALTLVVGFFIFRQRRHVSAIWRILDGRGLTRYAAPRLYELTVDRTIGLARGVTGFLQNGSQRRYLRILLLVVIGLIGLPLVLFPVGIPEAQPLSLTVASALAMISFGAIFTTRMRTPLTAILTMGAIGYGIALLFALYGAPDLALTQLLVETLTLILFAYALTRLPVMTPESSLSALMRDSALSLAFGIAVVVGLLAITASPSSEPVSDFYRALSLVEGQGRNVVNVILVDFRAFDTLGEITVLVIAVIGVAALLDYTSLRREKS